LFSRQEKLYHLDSFSICMFQVWIHPVHPNVGSSLMYGGEYSTGALDLTAMDCVMDCFMQTRKDDEEISEDAWSGDGKQEGGGGSLHRGS
jgi:hypothetical protein